MAVPVARRDGAGLRGGRDQGRQGHLLERTQKSHFVQHGRCRHARRAARQRACEVDRRAGLLRPQRRRRLRDGRRGAGQGGRQAGARCNTCATRAPAGTRRARPRSTARAPRIDAQGNVIAYEFLSKGFSRVDVDTNGSKPFDTLAGQTSASPLKSGDGFGVPAESYEFANKRTSWETIPPLLDRSSPLRTSHLRDPVGPANPLRQRIVHGRGGGGAPTRTRSSSG